MTPVDVVRAYFESLDDRWLGGELATWAALQAPADGPSPYEHTRAVHEVQLVEEHETRAVVSVRAENVARIPRGTFAWHTSFDGPVVLERTGDGWRIVDYTLDGRARSDSVVVGPLAEQENAGITVRVLGVDLTPRATRILVEVENGTAEEARVDRLFVVHGGRWRRAGGAARALSPGESVAIQHTIGAIERSHRSVSVAAVARLGRRRLPFLLHVPLARPAAPFRSAPPRRLPLAASAWAAGPFGYAVLTAVIAWWLGWFALLVPVFVVLVYWRHWRTTGRLPERLYAVRHVLDVAVVAVCCVVPWLTPAPYLAVPIAVGVASYLLLGVARVGDAVRFTVAISVATGWLALLGGPDGPLSPCRLAGGDPGDTADAFAMAVLRADRPAARALETAGARRVYRLVTRPVTSARAARAVARRRDLTSSSLCHDLAGPALAHCYVYPLGAQVLPVYVGLRCEARDWRVAVAF
jgi:hypothetical protein